MYLSLGFHHVVFYEDNVNECRAQKPNMSETNISSGPISIGHGCVQGTWVKWHHNYYLRHYIYLISKDVTPEDSIAPAYVSSLSIAIKGDRDRAKDYITVVRPGNKGIRMEGNLDL